ncbi:MAG: rRNA maturation RNase YbeY [Fretibacterium sp.]|nr:rRNA maturation RNase YbeY [Fretibacterium sp.]
MKLVLNVDASDEGEPQSPVPITSALEPVLERELLELYPDAARCELAEVSVSLMTPEEIRRINREYRDCDEATDVLSFPMCEEEQTPSGEKFSLDLSMPVLPLGDVVICPEETARLHPELPPDEAMCLMLAHSFLHLLGWDHDTEERQKAMWARQDALKARLLAALAADEKDKISCLSAGGNTAHPCASAGTKTSCLSAGGNTAHPCASAGTKTSCLSEAR